MPKAEGEPGLIMRSEVFRRSLKVDSKQKSYNPGVQGFEGHKVSRHVGIYL